MVAVTVPEATNEPSFTGPSFAAALSVRLAPALSGRPAGTQRRRLSRHLAVKAVDPLSVRFDEEPAPLITTPFPPLIVSASFAPGATGAGF